MDGADRFAGGAIVENLDDIFEIAEITGGDSRNILVVGDPDGNIIVGSATLIVEPWTGRVTLDNKGNVALDDTGFLNELYVITLTGGNAARVLVRDTGEGSGVDEIVINGTGEADQITLEAIGSGQTRIGSVVFGDLASPERDIVTYRQMEFVSVNTLGGDDRVLSNDTASVTIINLGTGDDEIVIATVPLKPDTGNRTLEYPEGVPVVDTENLTNGNSNVMFIMGQDQNDRFEVNYNRAQLYLHGGSGDDRFLLKTFLVLREDMDNPEEITNLAKLFGGEGHNRYSYLENGPVEINGGPGIDTLVVVGTPIGDIFVITNNVIAGAGRVVSFRNIEAIEVDGGGGADDIYVLSTSDDFTTTIRGGSGDDTIHIGGDHPPLVFDPPAFEYQPPAISVELPPTLEYVTETINFGTRVFETGIGLYRFFISGEGDQGG
jgi:microcompartment protein CcmK/EutM